MHVIMTRCHVWLHSKSAALQIVHRRDHDALQAFAQDAYQCSLAYGPQDVRTSLAYYNLAKVFQGMKEPDKSLACCDQVCALTLACPMVLSLSAMLALWAMTYAHAQEFWVAQAAHDTH